jgi:hypothetical protein
MAQPPGPDPQIRGLLSDFNTRLKDVDEKNKIIRERVLLLGKNLINSRQETEEEIKKIKQENSKIQKDLDKLKRTSNALLTEFNKFVKREELAMIERMLKDFQPLEFVRRKDVEELIENKINIKTTKQVS